MRVRLRIGGLIVTLRNPALQIIKEIKMTNESIAPKCECKNRVFNRYCGAYICQDCDRHIGLTRCYCGWSEFGENGLTELWEMGETVEPDCDW